MSLEKPNGRRTYSDEDRARGLAALKAVGGRTKLAEAATGIPESTLDYWQKSARVTSVSRRYPDLRAKSEAILERRFLNGTLKGLTRLQDDDLWQKGNVQQVAIATGVMHTHLRLLRSQPTSISETRDLASFLAASYGKVVDTKGKPSEE